MKLSVKFLTVIFLLVLIPLILSDDAICARKHSASSQSITVKKDRNFVIDLKSNPTTGYSWALLKNIDKRFVRIMGSKYIPYKTGFTGSGGKEIWTFKALSKGKTSLVFGYKRSWEKDIPPIETKKFIIDIK